MPTPYLIKNTLLEFLIFFFFYVFPCDKTFSEIAFSQHWGQFFKSNLAITTAWKWKYSEMFEFRIRDHDSLESWGIQGAHLTWSILKYSARIHPNILCWVSFVDFPKRTLHKFHRPVIDGNNLSVMMKKIENLKDWKPFLILLDVGGFKSLETVLYLFLARTHLPRVFKSFSSVHIKLQEV